MLSSQVELERTVLITAKERLLAAADELFYAEGVSHVGIDRVVEHAGVAKATLYNAFGSKEALIRAYLERRQSIREVRFKKALAPYDSPRDRLLAIFDVVGGVFAQPGFRGCAFLNVQAQSPLGGTIQEICDEARGWLHALFHDLVMELGVAQPDELVQQLVMLYDGATVAATMDRNLEAASVARNLATLLVDSAPRLAVAP